LGWVWLGEQIWTHVHLCENILVKLVNISMPARYDSHLYDAQICQPHNTVSSVGHVFNAQVQ